MVLTAGVGVAMIAVGIALAVSAPSDPHGRGLWLQVALGASCALFGAALIAAVAVDRVVLSEDAIEVRQLGFGRRRARRDQIRGLRVVSTQYVRTVELALEPGTKPIKIGLWHAMDAELETWLRSLPDLDAEDRARSEAEILAHTALGPNPGDRAAALVKARRIARVVEGVGGLAMVWGFVYPRPFIVLAAVLTALPLVAVSIVATGRGLYQLEGRRGDARPMIIVSIIGPGLLLALRTMLDVHLLDAWPLAPWALVIALVLAALVVAPERDVRVRWKNALLLAPLLAVYAGGVLVLADAMLDRAPRETHRVEVLGRQAVGGRPPSWELELAPWGPVHDRDTYRVPFALFDETEVGTEVCAELGEGALGARWYVIRACARE